MKILHVVGALSALLTATACQKESSEVGPVPEAKLQARWQLNSEDYTHIDAKGVRKSGSFSYATNPTYLSFDATMWKYSGGVNSYYNYSLRDSVLYLSDVNNAFTQLNDTVSIVELTAHSLILRNTTRIYDGGLYLSKSRYSR